MLKRSSTLLKAGNEYDLVLVTAPLTKTVISVSFNDSIGIGFKLISENSNIKNKTIRLIIFSNVITTKIYKASNDNPKKKSALADL
jgi:hypothetical protein